MKKLFRILIVSMVLVMSLSVAAFADSSSAKLRDTLKTIGVSSQYSDRVVSYLQTVTITKQQSKELEGYIKSAKRIIGNEKNLANLTNNQRAELTKIATDAGKVLGLQVKISKVGNKQLTTMEIHSSKGLLVVLNSADARAFISNFKIEVLSQLLSEVYKFSNDPHKGESGKRYNPNEGDLNQTGLPYGNVMAMGSSMIGMAGGVYFISRKKF